MILPNIFYICRNKSKGNLLSWQLEKPPSARKRVQPEYSVGNGTSPSLFIVSNLLRTRCLDGDAAPSDTLSITQAIKAEVTEQRKEPCFHKVH